MHRRAFLLGSLAAAVGSGIARPGRSAVAATGSAPLALHVLNRLGYGPRPSDIDYVAGIGIDRYIAQQLAPEHVEMPQGFAAKLDRFATLRLSPLELFQEYGPPAVRGLDRKPSPDEIKANRQRARIIFREAAAARLLRATESPAQLLEVMVEFWFNHFNVFAGKGLDHLWIGAYERDAIRPHALGRFRTLLGATAKHPAMLFYLDNWQNTAPGSPGARGKEQGLNENYAREIMELHTLGVDGGYTQQDVIALARILTGWGLPQPGGARRRRTRFGGASEGGFHFDDERHDFGDKQLLGHAIKGRGIAEGEEAMDILARHPATAKHVSTQLAQYFVADEPPPALVEMLAKRFRDSDGDIREVLRALFASPQFRDPAGVGGKFKTPYQFVVSAVRLADIPVLNPRPMLATMAQLGMPLYGCQTPDGYKNSREAWLNPDAMARRLNFATALGAGRLPIDRPPPMEEDDEPEPTPGMRQPVAAHAEEGPALRSPLDAARLIRALGGEVSEKTRSAVETAPVVLRGGLVLGSPDFMSR